MIRLYLNKPCTQAEQQTNTHLYNESITIFIYSLSRIFGRRYKACCSYVFCKYVPPTKVCTNNNALIFTRKQCCTFTRTYQSFTNKFTSMGSVITALSVATLSNHCRASSQRRTLSHCHRHKAIFDINTDLHL